MALADNPYLKRPTGYPGGAAQAAVVPAPRQSRPPAGAYKQAEITTLSQKQLLLKLFEGCDRFLRQAQEAMRNKQIEAAHINCTKAKDIIAELLATLNFEAGGDIAVQLKDIYLFLIMQIAEANAYKDPARIEPLLPVLATLQDAWSQIPDEHANTSSLPPGHDSHTLDFRS